MKIKYLKIEEVIAIHFDQIERYGGTHGIRDLTLLESAVYRPHSSFDGKDLNNDIFTKVASLIQSIALNHPFIDGNKRSSIVAGLRFLDINGLKLRISQSELVEFTLKIAKKEIEIEDIASFLKEHCKKYS